MQNDTFSVIQNFMYSEPCYSELYYIPCTRMYWGVLLFALVPFPKAERYSSGTTKSLLKIKHQQPWTSIQIGGSQTSVCLEAPGGLIKISLGPILQLLISAGLRCGWVMYISNKFPDDLTLGLGTPLWEFLF